MSYILNMRENFLKVEIKPRNLRSILEQIDMCISKSCVFLHIVSINPENVMIAQKDDLFRKILSEGDIQIIDGIGVALGGSFLGIEVGDRITGVDLMDTIIKKQGKEGLHVLLLGGKANIAEELAECYQKKYPHSFFKGITGIQNIKSPKIEEERQIFSIVADYKPQIIFAAFGSPWQEKWFWDHKTQLKGCICMGVGGGFDFASGQVARAPIVIRKVGLEWLFRLVKQPWRIKRQTRLLSFVLLLLKAKLSSIIFGSEPQ